MPIQTGWDRTFSLREIAFQIGTNDEVEGYSFRSVQDIQKRTGIRLDEAEMFAHFVRDMGYVTLRAYSSKNAQTDLVSRLLPPYFSQSYDRLTRQLFLAEHRDGKVVKALAQFIPAYNQLVQEDPLLAAEVKKSLLDMPIETGWNQALSVRTLAFQIGVREEVEGYSFYSPQDIQKHTGVSLDEANIVAPFIRALW